MIELTVQFHVGETFFLSVREFVLPATELRYLRGRQNPLKLGNGLTSILPKFRSAITFTDLFFEEVSSALSQVFYLVEAHGQRWQKQNYYWFTNIHLGFAIYSGIFRQIKRLRQLAGVNIIIILFVLMRKRNQRLHDYQTMGRKICCGKFAESLKNNFAVGDQDNNLILYNLISPKPIAVLNPQASNNVSALTALTFTRSDEQVVVGSSRGSLNVWDLNTLKINFCLKGHTVEVCSLFADRKYDHLIVSGSSDTNAKVWDLRTKNCQHNIKNHNKKITALCIGTESRILATGGEDGIVQTFDLKMMKPIYEYKVDSPVLSLDINANNYLAMGNMDRMARVYQAYSPFSLVGCTKNQTMPISSVVFHKQDYLFTAGTDNLKVWDLANQFILTDNIETSSKGILHMVLDDKVQQIAFSGGTLTYHQCMLSEVNFNGPYVYSNHSISHQRFEKVDEAIEKNNKIKRGSTVVNPLMHISNEKTKSLINRRNDSIAKQLTGVADNISDALSNIKRVSEQFSNRKAEGAELKEMMADQHTKFLKIMAYRAKSIQGLLDLWMKGNIKVLIHHLKSVDLYVVSDVLTQILKPSKITISLEFGLTIAERAREMIQSKHLTVIKSGLEYMLHIVALFKDDMIKLKTFGVDKGVDLAREERLKRFDQLIELYVEVYQSHRLKRLTEKKDESSKLAEKLQGEFIQIFKKVYGNQYEL